MLLLQLLFLQLPRIAHAPAAGQKSLLVAIFFFQYLTRLNTQVKDNGLSFVRQAITHITSIIFDHYVNNNNLGCFSRHDSTVRQH
jgi:hypothetical protein